MKALIWVGGFIVVWIIKSMLVGTEAHGGVLIWSIWFVGAPYLCKKWDKHKAKKKALEQTEEQKEA